MLIRAALLASYRALERVIVPGAKYSQYVYEDVLRSLADDHTHWLDLGCGHQVLPSWRAEQERQLVEATGKVIGIDVDIPSLIKHPTIRQRVAGSIGQLPFRDASFDLVTANMVVEHLPDPEAHFAEISRVLRPGGVLLLHTPNRRGHSTQLARCIPEVLKKRLVHLLQGRKQQDVFETFYRANTEEEIERLATGAGLDVGAMRLVVSSAELAVLAPVVLLELFWIRLLMTRWLRAYRPKIIAVLQKTRPRSAQDLSQSHDVQSGQRSAVTGGEFPSASACRS